MRSVRILLYVLTLFATRCSRREPIPTAGLKLWLRADAGVTLNCSTVARWADQSGSGNDAIQDDSPRQPQLVRDGLNGLPSLRFDGWDDRLGLTGLERVSRISLFLVIKLDSGASGPNPNSPLAFGDISGMGQVYGLGMRDFFTGDTPDSIFIYTGAGDVGVHIGAPNCAAFGRWNNINIVSDQTIWNTTSRINGEVASVTPSGGANMNLAFPLGNATGTGIGGIGGIDEVRLSPGRLVAKCEIAEVIVYSVVLSDSLERAVESYLGSKYSLPPRGAANR